MATKVNIIYQKNGEKLYHRLYSSGREEWHHEHLHREDGGPAIIQINGDEEWYINSQVHRDNNPAMICMNGNEYWYRKDRIYRKDGPCIIRGSFNNNSDELEI